MHSSGMLTGSTSAREETFEVFNNTTSHTPYITLENGIAHNIDIKHFITLGPEGCHQNLPPPPHFVITKQE